jgi:hypothetical protein
MTDKLSAKRSAVNSSVVPRRGIKLRVFVARGFWKPSDLSSRFILSFHSQKVSISETTPTPRWRLGINNRTRLLITLLKLCQLKT